jgi:Protein of unknown function DUF262
MADKNDDLFAEEGPEDQSEQPAKRKKTDRAIEREFSEGRLRVIQETNNLFLPHVVDFIKGRKWGNLRPEYQRRLRWSQDKKSKLIESFIMNVPVPPVFLYEKTLGRYEVMDGQQRLNAIVEFLDNDFPLTGLEIWPSLNDRNFKGLPSLIKRGLERAKLSTIILTSDVGGASDDIDLRAQVFDRLNTGGERLNAQELRNSIYGGDFNKVLLELSSNKNFTKAWGIPSHGEHIDSEGNESVELRTNNLYKRMLDIEIVLRFFAFRESEHVRGGVKTILDGAMKRNRSISDAEAAILKKRFVDALDVCVRIFGQDVFRVEGEDGKKRLSRPLFDAEMIAVDRHMDNKAKIIARKSEIAAAVARIAQPKSTNYPLMVGRANTADSIKKRIDLVSAIVNRAIK